MASRLEISLWYGVVLGAVVTLMLHIWRNVPRAGAKWWSVSFGAVFLHRLTFPSDDIPLVVLVLALACFFARLWVMRKEPE